METKYLVLKNPDRGLFLITKENEKWFTEKAVGFLKKRKITKEFLKANFKRITQELEIASTSHFNFRRYNEDKEDGIIWIEELN
jgi:hypothetical protein